MTVKWLGGDITAGFVWAHGDDEHQEFYDHMEVTTAGILTIGVFKNHGENVWIAYACHGDAAITFNSVIRHLNGDIDKGPMYGVDARDPHAMLDALYNLYHQHGSRIMEL